MFGEYIYQKVLNKSLTKKEYYNIVNYLVKNGCDKEIIKMFFALNSFGMTKKEVLYLTLALRDSGEVVENFESTIEKHSTGGIGDSSSLVLVPLLSSLGYKMIKTSGKSMVYTNGSSDRINAIPNFKTDLSKQEIEEILNKVNACFLSHGDNVCPADKLLFEIMEKYGLNEDVNLLASSIACKKLVSSPKVVLIDVKYGDASNIKNYKQAIKISKLLRYIFKKLNVKSIIVLTNTLQTVGEGVGNALELQDAIDVLKGKKCNLREMSEKYATEVIKALNSKLDKKDIEEMVASNLDNSKAYNKFVEIVKAQNGDVKSLDKLFNPYKVTNFVCTKNGYVGLINTLSLGEITRQLCEDSHDDNIGIKIHVKIGDFVKKGQKILSFYYKNDEDLQKYKEVLFGAVRLTDVKLKKIKTIKKVIR